MYLIAWMIYTTTGFMPSLYDNHQAEKVYPNPPNEIVTNIHCYYIYIYIYIYIYMMGFSVLFKKMVNYVMYKSLYNVRIYIYIYIYAHTLNICISLL